MDLQMICQALPGQCGLRSYWNKRKCNFQTPHPSSPNTSRRHPTRNLTGLGQIARKVIISHREKTSELQSFKTQNCTQKQFVILQNSINTVSEGHVQQSKKLAVFFSACSFKANYTVMHCYNLSFTCALQDEVLANLVLEKMDTLVLSGKRCIFSFCLTLVLLLLSLLPVCATRKSCKHNSKSD